VCICFWGDTLYYITLDFIYSLLIIFYSHFKDISDFIEYYTSIIIICIYLGIINEHEDDYFLFETCSSEISVGISGYFRNSVRSGTKK
jgi:hypothetical protein